MFSKIVLMGGSTMLPGIEERMKRDLQARVPPNTEVRVSATPDRRYSVWIGGSIMASMCGFQTPRYWLGRKEYDEHGTAIIHEKYV